MQLYKSEAHVQDFERGLIFKIGQMWCNVSLYICTFKPVGLPSLK
jgi:hypothetical protein